MSNFKIIQNIECIIALTEHLLFYIFNLYHKYQTLGFKKIHTFSRIFPHIKWSLRGLPKKINIMIEVVISKVLNALVIINLKSLMINNYNLSY